MTSVVGTKPLTNQEKEKAESVDEETDGFQHSRPDHCMVKEEESGPVFCVKRSRKRPGEELHSSIKL